MSRKSLSLVLVLVLLVLGASGCQKVKDKLSNKIPALEKNLPESLTIAIDEQNDSGISGTATLNEVEGRLHVVVDIKGTGTDQILPAHLHYGTCDGLGEIYQFINYPYNGLSDTMLDVNVKDLDENLPLVINVHKSELELDEYVACGEVKF